MGTLLSFSKSTTTVSLEISEIALFLFGVLLVVGLIGEYAESEKWKRYVKTFEMCVIIGVAGELFTDGGIFVFSNRLQTIANQEIAVLTKQSGDTKDSAVKAADAATIAKNQSDAAVASAFSALDLAKGARREADTFEQDIRSAKKEAAAAESHLAEATKSANILTAKLERLTSPRRLPHSEWVVAPLKMFSGTKYVFIGTCGDQECFDLVSDIDELLQVSGWKRIKGPPMNLGIPQFRIHGDKDFAVNLTASTGTGISAEIPNGLDSVKNLPADQLPEHLRAGIALNEVLALNISPSENTGRLVGVDTGTSTAVRIEVGRKPL